MNYDNPPRKVTSVILAKQDKDMWCLTASTRGPESSLLLDTKQLRALCNTALKLGLTLEEWR